MNNQLFISYTWQNDIINRNNQQRVYSLYQELKKYNWSIWIDKENMIGNMDAAMATGIENAEAIIVCITTEYCKKVNESAKNPRLRDNCLKEWTYANARNKLMIPIIMESSLLNIKNWPPSIISLYFGSTLYIDASTENYKEIANNINKLLLKYDLIPSNNQTMKTSVKKFQNVIYNIRRKSVPNTFENKYKLIRNKWKTTGNLKEISI